MKKLLLGLGILVFTLKMNSQCTGVVNIPDANLLSALLNFGGLDANTDGQIQCAEAQAWTGALGLSSKGIIDPTGLEAFENISTLQLNNNQIDSIDISSLTSLQNFQIRSNGLLKITTGSHPYLNSLMIDGNQLTALDVLGMPNLSLLWCQSNQISSLHLANNALLSELWCSGNGVTVLDVSNQSNLITLKCYNNQLTSLNVSGSSFLRYLDCHGNLLGNLDLSNNDELQTIDCDYNELTSLAVSNMDSLRMLSCNVNQLTTLDLSQNADLRVLECGVNSLTSLNVSGADSLYKLYCFDNHLQAMDLSSHPILQIVWINDNDLSYLNVANGNNMNMTGSSLQAKNNQNLTCITVDDPVWSDANWWNGNLIDTAIVSFSTNCPNFSGVNSVNNDKEILLYPNPASDFVTVGNLSNDIDEVLILDITGKRIENILYFRNQIDVRSLSRGVYFLQIHSGGEVIRSSVVIE